VLERQLPNGWTFGLSNEVYRAADGTIYEGVGIPPDLDLEGQAYPYKDREESVDRVLEQARGIARIGEPMPLVVEQGLNI